MRPDEIEMLKLYFDEFKYRHSHYWSMVFRFAFAILFLLGIPYIYPTSIASISDYVVIFPIAAILLSLSASWLLLAEYERLRAINQKYNQLRPAEYRPVQFGNRGLRRVLGGPVGYIVSFLFLFTFLGLSIMELLIFLTSKA